MTSAEWLQAAQIRRCLITKLEETYREYKVFADPHLPGYNERISKVIDVMADVSEFNHDFPTLSIPKMVDGKVPVPILGAPKSDTNGPELG